MGRVMKTMVLIVGLAGASAAEEQVRPPERYVRLGHYQCVCRQGDFEANLQTVIHGLELAADARVQILSFPESFRRCGVTTPPGPLRTASTLSAATTARVIARWPAWPTTGTATARAT